MVKAKPNTNFLVVNNSYGTGTQIEKLYKGLNISTPIYVLSNNYYGNKKDKKVEKFVKELCDTCMPDPNYGLFVFDRNSKLKSYSQNIAGMKF